MSLLRIDPASAIPPYEQLRTQVVAMTVTGELEPGQKLPTVRQLAADLGLAPNTVARAYRELEADGTSPPKVAAARSSPAVRSMTPRSTAIGAARKAAASFTEAARRSGLSLPEATRLVEASWPRTSS